MGVTDSSASKSPQVRPTTRTATIAEARHLWHVVARPNVMIKVPATREGIPAVEALTAEGINVNITLMFSLDHYEAVAQAYLRGLERHPDPHRVASVASVFVSRLDAVADPLLERSVRRTPCRCAGRLPSRTPDVSIVDSVKSSTASAFATAHPARCPRPTAALG